MLFVLCVTSFVLALLFVFLQAVIYPLPLMLALEGDCWLNWSIPVWFNVERVNIFVRRIRTCTRIQDDVILFWFVRCVHRNEILDPVRFVWFVRQLILCWRDLYISFQNWLSCWKICLFVFLYRRIVPLFDVYGLDPMVEVLALYRSVVFWTSLSFYIHLWPLDGSKTVHSDWSLPVQSGCRRFDPFGFKACVVFSKRL